MELRHLRYFIAVAEELHFGRAARRLRIAQPPLSRQIQELEEELGFFLFDRSRRRVDLTEAGKTMLVHARSVLDALDLGVRESRRAAAGKVGRIAVGYLSSVAFSGLPELLLAFRARSPDVDIILRELPPQEQVDALLDRRIDVGFIRGPANEPELALRRVRRERLLLALPKGHALAARTSKPIALAEVAREPFVVFPRSRGPVFYDQLMRICHDAGFAPRIVQEAPQLDIVSLVAAGFGVAILPASLELARRPGIVFRDIAGAPTTELLIAWRPNDPSLVVRDFLEVVDRVGMKPAKLASSRARRAR